MKKFLIPLFLILALCSCQSKSEKISTDLINNPKSATSNLEGKKQPVIVFEKTNHDFGKLIQGEQVSYTFKFKNTGDAPLIITAVEKTCGCTDPKFSNKPVAPGEEGKITINYDSKGHKGFQNRRLVVKSNANPSETILNIKAQVETIDTF